MTESEDSKIIEDSLWRPPLHETLNCHVINSSCSPAQFFSFRRGYVRFAVSDHHISWQSATNLGVFRLGSENRIREAIMEDEPEICR